MPDTKRIRAGVTVLVAVSTLALSSGTLQAREYHSYAHVNDNGTLRVSGRLIRLHGIHIPRTARQCESRIRRARCATQAALALDFKIRGFVRCHELQRFTDRSIAARCFNRDTDLGAYLIEQGWAVAAPNAPFEYRTLERIAERRGMGVWGTGVDSKSRRRN